MARGQRKTVEEKIEAKQTLIDALMSRLESEKKELNELYGEKKRRELSKVEDLIDETGLNTEEVAMVLKKYMDEQRERVS